MDFQDLHDPDCCVLSDVEGASAEACRQLDALIQPLIKGPVQPLLVSQHRAFIQECLRQGSNYHGGSFYALQPWLAYWSLHALDLLALHDGISYEAVVDRSAMANTLRRLQSPLGGFAGMPDALPHLASTYAAVVAACILGAYDVVDVDKLVSFCVSMFDAGSGSFHLYDAGESDLRGTYCALVCCLLCNRLQQLLDRCGGASIVRFIERCQCRWEGGMGPTPLTEAHAGYTFCGVASLEILRQAGYPSHAVDLQLLQLFCHRRQDPRTGGMNGRTNKLVDGCYSFWVQASILLLSADGGDRSALRAFILNACQACELSHVALLDEDGDDGGSEQSGGLRDKPGKRPDLYHTCYCLSGLALVDKVNDWTLLDPVCNVLRSRRVTMQRHFGAN